MESELEPEPESVNAVGCTAKPWASAVGWYLLMASTILLSIGIAGCASEEWMISFLDYLDSPIRHPDQEELILDIPMFSVILIVSSIVDLIFSLLLLIGIETESYKAVRVWWWLEIARVCFYFIGFVSDASAGDLTGISVIMIASVLGFVLNCVFIGVTRFYLQELLARAMDNDHDSDSF